MTRGHWSLLVAATAVSVIGVAEAIAMPAFDVGDVIAACIVAVSVGVAVGLHRTAPGLAMLVLYLGGALQLVTGIDFLLVQLASGIVFYGLARYERALVAWGWIAATPFAYIAIGLHLRAYGSQRAASLGVSELVQNTTHPVRWAVVIGVMPVMIPLLIGYIRRLDDRRSAAESQLDQARQSRRDALDLAADRQSQVQLAREVHDVVGHSLAAIAMQAESGQYIRDVPDQARDALANIASAARQSLIDIRLLLETGQARTEDLDAVITRVRDAGADVETVVEGREHLLSPELATVACRVLQEMLSNALRHGVAGEPIVVERRWADVLTLTTSNRFDPSMPRDGRVGIGLAGMRSRLENVGGDLLIRRSAERFEVSATLPTSGAGPAVQTTTSGGVR